MNCLRCGREISDELSFCGECRKTVDQPLKQSPYLSTQILLPAKRRSAKTVPVKGGRKTERKPEKPTGKTSGALAVFLGALCILILVYALVLSLFYLDVRSERAEAQSAAAALEKENRFLLERMDYISQSIVLVSPEEKRYYHRADCPLADADGCKTVRLRTAQMLGYQPCPECH